MIIDLFTSKRDDYQNRRDAVCYFNWTVRDSIVEMWRVEYLIRVLGLGIFIQTQNTNRLLYASYFI